MSEVFGGGCVIGGSHMPPNIPRARRNPLPRRSSADAAAEVNQRPLTLRQRAAARDDVNSLLHLLPAPNASI
jgi:hypothetical protein